MAKCSTKYDKVLSSIIQGEGRLELIRQQTEAIVNFTENQSNKSFLIETGEQFRKNEKDIIDFAVEV